MESILVLFVVVLSDSAICGGGIDCFYGPGIRRPWWNYFSTGALGPKLFSMK